MFEVIWPNKFKGPGRVDLNVPFLNDFQRLTIKAIAEKRATHMCQGVDFFRASPDGPHSPVAQFALVWYAAEQLYLTVIGLDKVIREITPTPGQPAPIGAGPPGPAPTTPEGRMLEQLTANPGIIAGYLAGCNDWTSRFLGRKVELNPNLPFLPQVVKLAEEGSVITNSTYWDPYDDGYDDGPPDDYLDHWHTDDTISTGQYRGLVVEGAFDKLSAIVGALTYENGDVDETNLTDEFVKQAEEDWTLPRSAQERDRAVTADIRRDFKLLSLGARVALLAELAAWVTCGYVEMGEQIEED